MPRTRTAWLVAAMVTLVVGAGCAIGAPSSPQDPGAAPQRTNTPSAEEANGIVRSAITDVERYWSGAFPKLSGGEAFKPVSGGYHPYTREDPPPSCGGQRWEYQPNAFYCSEGDFIAWDAETLIPQLDADFGPLLVAVVIAHEYGHAVQMRLGVGQQPTIVLEQQADCFAGSWIADVAAGHSKSFAAPKPEELDSTVGGLLSLRDQPGVPAQDQQAHGNAFDRVRALQEGIEQGPSRCASYRANNLPVTEIPFSSADEAANGGDLPYQQAVTELSQDAQAYWQRVLPQQWKPLKVEPFNPPSAPACSDKQPPGPEAAGSAFYCPSGNFIAFDNRQLGPQLYQHIGDNAVGMLLGDLFARAALARRGRSADGRAGQLMVDCMAGSWSNDLLTRRGADQLRLSPGDLDEAVAALLVFGRAGGSGDASAFDRIGAYRNGVLGGLDACS